MIETWTAWFGDFATEAAAKRHLTTHFVGPKVRGRDEYIGTEIRQSEGRFQVRLLQAPIPSLLEQLNS
jgi:hypothetical protein